MDYMNEFMNNSWIHIQIGALDASKFVTSIALQLTSSSDFIFPSFPFPSFPFPSFLFLSFPFLSKQNLASSFPFLSYWPGKERKGRVGGA